ncbi:uncharacterized protein LOC134245079 isoform X2 [Saccostrea cucullata]|uniref:uncharacterized protein LOC134245079 isoform X2 n=1 Tax=Saccostrea cuccullata TaxID=36930 RepID=UPI002ED33CA2
MTNASFFGYQHVTYEKGISKRCLCKVRSEVHLHESRLSEKSQQVFTGHSKSVRSTARMDNHLLRCCLLVFTGLLVEAITTGKFMINNCNTKREIFVKDSIIFKLTNQPLSDRPSQQLHCTSNLVTEPDKRLLIHFTSLSISMENDTPDNLHIYDFDSKGHAQMVTPASGLFGIYDKFYKRTSIGVGDYISSKNRFRLTYVGSPTLTYSGFDILITSVKDVQRDGSCPRLYGRCIGRNVCVHYSVWCDGEENCGEGDLSDEEACDDVITDDWKYTYYTTMAVVSAIIAIVMFITTIGVVICLLRRYNRRNMRNMSITVSAKKQGDKWTITNDLGLSLGVAPPLYDDIVLQRQEEPPPSYDTLRFKQAANTPPEEQNVTTNECITVACIETLNPVGGFTDDVLCLQDNSHDEFSLAQTEKVEKEVQNNNSKSNESLKNPTSEGYLLSSCKNVNKSEQLPVDQDDSYASENDDEIETKKNVATEVNICSAPSQCSVETGFVSMESNSPRDSGSEDSPRHDVIANQLHQDVNLDTEGIPLLMQCKKQGTTERIQFIDELSEDSNIIN